MQSSGKITSSAPSSRARPIHSLTFAALASIAPTVGLIWARTTRIALRGGSYPKYLRPDPPGYFRCSVGLLKHAEPPAPPGRYLGGAAIGPRRGACCAGIQKAVHPAAGAADGRAAAADRRPGPQPQRLLGPGGEEVTGLLAALLRPLGRPGARRARPRRPQRRRRPRFRRTGAEGGRTRPRRRERQARLAGAAQRRAPGRAQRQDRRLPLADRRRTVRLRGAGPRPGDQAAPDPAAAARLPRPRQRLQRLRVPEDEAAQRPRGHVRPRVQPHPPVRLRRLSRPLVRRVQCDLDGGSGLQRDRRLPALRSPLGEALGNAADYELDQGVRQRRLEPVAGAPLRRGDPPRGPGRARRHGEAIVREAWAGAIDAKPGGCSVAAYERAIRAAGPSDFSHDFTRFAADLPEWRTGEGVRESRLYPDVPRQGHLPLDGGRLTRSLNHTTFQLLRVRARTGRAGLVRGPAPRGFAAGLALVGRLGSERQGHTVKRVEFKRGGGQLTVRLPRPGRFKRITAV